MTPYAKDLLTQAEGLLAKDSRRPKQANLRRGVSSAYYALFHGLSDEGSRHLYGSWLDRDALRKIVPRLFAHEQMKSACKSFALVASGRPPRLLEDAFSKLSIAKIPLLHDVANCFVELQEARHTADYDLSVNFTREEVRNWIQRVTKAFSDLEGLKRTHPEAVALFALCLLHWNAIQKR